MEINYVGVDWLTMTTKDERIGQQWWNTYTKYRKARYAEGNVEGPFHNGYYGGQRIDKMSVGHSDQIGYIVVVSGGDAERLFQRLNPTKSRVTRLDLCIDFSFEAREDIAGRLFNRATHNKLQKQRKFSLISNSEGGKTFYLGSRHSQQCGRVYDKGVESKRSGPGALWRAEVEYKKPRAGNIAKALAGVQPADREIAICDTVCEWFADRNAELFPRGQIAKALHIQVEERITTANRKLAWLRTSVAPTVQGLIETGYGRRVLGSLLLDEQAVSEAYRHNI